MEVAGWFIGAGIGAVFTALYDGVEKLMGRSTNFKDQLEALKLTLESFDLEVIQQIGKHNQALGIPNEDVEALEHELNKGLRIIRELDDAPLWNRIDYRYSNQLVQLNKYLCVLERRVKMQSVRDMKETRHMVEILLRLTLQQEPSRDIGCGSLLSTRRLLDININAPQEAIHHMLQLTSDPASNIASTSTMLQQIHSNEVGNSSGHSNYRGSDNQPQINGGQLATTSSNTIKVKVVIKLSLHDGRTRSKAMKIAVGVDGVDSASLQQDKDQIEVTGNDVDVVLLTTLLRKSVKFAEVVSVKHSR